MRELMQSLTKRFRAQWTGRIDLRIAIDYDVEASVWHVVNTDIPGLWLEADTAPELIAKLAAAAPEMIELNIDQIAEDYGIRRQLKRERIHTVYDAPTCIGTAAAC